MAEPMFPPDVPSHPQGVTNSRQIPAVVVIPAGFGRGGCSVLESPLGSADNSTGELSGVLGFSASELAYRCQLCLFGQM